MTNVWLGLGSITERGMADGQGRGSGPRCGPVVWGLGRNFTISPTSSAASTPPRVGSPTKPSYSDDVCNNKNVHPTPPASSSDEGHSDSFCPSPLVFRSSLDKTDPVDPTSPSTPTRKRSRSPVRTRKLAQQTSPSQPMAREHSPRAAVMTMTTTLLLSARTVNNSAAGSVLNADAMNANN